jgi:hypothetical protein
VRTVAIYLAEPWRPAAAAYVAAAETLRAALFAADMVLYSPWLAPLAATLARATARPDPDAPAELLPLPRRGAMLALPEQGPPSAEEAASGEPFLRVIGQYAAPPDPDAARLLLLGECSVDGFVGI